jgi:hypothetical protein
MSDVSDPNTFVPIGTVRPTVVNTWTYFEVAFNTVPAGNNFIAFRQVESNGTNRIDDVDVRLWANCPRPVNVNVLNITSTSANITWTAGSSETEWNIIVSETAITDFDNIDPALINSVSTTPFHPVTGLDMGKRYYIYVQADCGGAGRIGRWTETIFRTLCDIIRSTSWYEDFDSYAEGDIPDCWTRIVEHTEYPQVIVTPYLFPEREIVLETTQSAPGALMFIGKSIVINNPFGEQTIATPKFAVEEPNTSMHIDFWVYKEFAAYGGGINSIQVGVMTDVSDATTFTLIKDVGLTANNNTWAYYKVSYSTMPGNYHVVFKRMADTHPHYVFDDVSITMTPPDFNPPSVITDSADNITATSATLHKTVTQHTYPITTQGFRYRTGTNMWINVTTTAAAETLTGLRPNTTYEFFAYAVPSLGGQVMGDTLTFTTKDAPVILPIVETNIPTSVTQTTATLNKTVTPGTETITAEGFGYRLVGGSGAWTSVASNGNLIGLTANTAYDFYAFASTASDTYYGDTLTFTTLSEDVIIPTVVTNLATNVTQTTATLNKTVTSGTEPVTEEGWYYKALADAIWIKVTDGNLTGLTANTAYEFYAFATAGSTYYGNTLTFTTPSNSVGYDTATVGMFIIYPNPANSMATVKVEGLRTSAKVMVTNISGKLIETLRIKSGDDKVEFDVANYAEGTYLVRVVANGINRVEKLIVKK